MITETFPDLLALLGLQRLLANPQAGHIVLGLLAAALVIVAVDYARMLLLHFKMVKNSFLTTSNVIADR